MKSLVDDMVQDDPAKRPTIDIVVERFGKILAGLSQWTLTSRLVKLEESKPSSFPFMRHLFRLIGNTLAFRNPLPISKR